MTAILRKYAYGAALQPPSGRDSAVLQMSDTAPIPASFLQTSYPTYVEELNKSRRCATCFTEFREFQNIGLFHCAVHSGLWIDSVSRWSCCNSPVRVARGCVRCDHSDAAVRSVEVVFVPLFIYELLPQKPLGALVLDSGGALTLGVNLDAARLLFCEDLLDEEQQLQLSATETAYFKRHAVPVRRKEASRI